VNKKTEPSTTRIKSNAARWQRLKNILADALEQTSPEERTAVLKQSCAGDTALLREAEKLLAYDTTTFEEFAEFAGTRLRDNGRNRIGERIGAYAVIRELGRGGVGAVFLAERADGQFEKRVAIKVLKRGTDTDEVLRRFRIERQILANLEHPNITRLLDAGTTSDSLPYFVMEFVEGTPITKFVKREKVGIAGRLELLLKICSAVALAHRHQVIHRDIKPGNVLVNDEGEPKLLDFGIAKLFSADSDDGNITVAAEHRLTPMYASPEQKAGQSATIASDVYSLGVLLYELLTAQPPRSSSNGDVSMHLTETDLPSHVVTDSQTKDALQGQLDQIVARAMQRDPAQRYSSVADLSKDIERYLNGAALLSENFSMATSEEESAPGNSKVGANSGSHWYITAAGLGVIVLAAAVLSREPAVRWLGKGEIRNAAPGMSPAKVTDSVRSIAVLPFEALGQNMNDELLGLGMADAVIGRMSSLKQLVVLPTSAISKYKGPANDPLAAGRTLGVDAVLSGTIQRSGDRIRATVQLVRVASGRTVWSDKFDQAFTDIFSIQDSISDKVARSLIRDFSKEEQKQLLKHYTSDTVAYDSYLMGIYFWNKRSKDGLEKAIDYFQHAVERDPGYALAYAVMADCYFLQQYYGYDSAPDRIGNAKAAAERALLLDDSIAESHLAIGDVQLCQKNYQTGMESFRRALALNPNLAIAHQRYAWALCSFGHLDDAVREMKRAQELDPLSPTNNTALGVILVFARQFRGALEYCYKAAELAPNEAFIQENLATAYALNGMYQQAIEHYQRVGELNPENKGDALAWVATVLVSAGRKPEADRMMPEILQLATRGKADPYEMTLLYAARGEKERAFEWLDKTLQKGSGGVRSYNRMIRYDPMLDSLRADSKFAELLKQHNRSSLLETTAIR
jgi:eukaryotic-like serine/threonine-protein kinase